MRDGWSRSPDAGEAVRFLEGPRTRRFELRLALGIFTELIRGFRALHFVGPCVTVFGSARFKEDHPNAHLDRWITFRHFFVRKVMLVKYAYAFVALPGGFGTLDETFETATLIQTRKIQNFPLILVGREFWRPLTDFLHGPLEQLDLIDPRDAARIVVTDSAAEAVAAVGVLAIPPFGLRYRAPRRRGLLNE